jgi:hypothetical protein
MSELIFGVNSADLYKLRYPEVPVPMVNLGPQIRWNAGMLLGLPIGECLDYPWDESLLRELKSQLDRVIVLGHSKSTAITTTEELIRTFDEERRASAVHPNMRLFLTELWGGRIPPGTDYFEWLKGQPPS